MSQQVLGAHCGLCGTAHPHAARQVGVFHPESPMPEGENEKSSRKVTMMDCGHRHSFCAECLLEHVELNLARGPQVACPRVSECRVLLTPGWIKSFVLQEASMQP